MTEELFQLVRATAFVLAFGFAVSLQRAFPHSRFLGSWKTNGALWTLNLLVVGVACGACACAAAQWAAAGGIGVFHQVSLSPWIAAAITVPFLDLVSYGWHRANHRWAILWRFHRVHHSDLSFTVSTAFRFHPGELLLSLPLRLAAVVALGAPVEGIIVFESVFMISNLVEHGDIRLPERLERRLANLFIVPSLHRRHHSPVATELDSNFGTILSVWDRCFGTYGPSSSSRRFRIGLPDIPDPLSLPSALRLPISAPGR